MNRFLMAAALSSVLLASSRASAEPFLRGDSNGDDRVDISDMIHLLNHLFRGGPGTCPDIIDVNDDGIIDVSDAIFGLGFLFLGDPEPPYPGSLSPGFDGTPTDPFTCGDPPPTELPGVSFDFSGVPDTITLAEAAAGVLFRYSVLIEENLHGVISFPLDAGGCADPGVSGLKVLEVISGGGQMYCLCDTGLCGPQIEPMDLVEGSYKAAFEWTGRNWSGPSDTSNPMGPPFPPGRYLFEVRARGIYPEAEGTLRLFEVTATAEFELTP